MLLRPNPSSGVPIYLQLMEQVKHSIETGALRPGERQANQFGNAQPGRVQRLEHRAIAPPPGARPARGCG